MAATELLFRTDPYLSTIEATVVATSAEGIVLDRSVFYAAGGGQPGDSGRLERADGTILTLANAIYGADRSTVLHVPATSPPETDGAQPAVAEPAAADLPAVGEKIVLHLDWARRYAHMRMHTALHLLSAVLPFPVTGGQIGAEEGRLDFDIPEAVLERDDVTARLNDLIAGDHPVSTEWITDDELLANPGLVKTMSVKPPMGSGRVRLVRIGSVDLQPCGGTHVAATAEIGRAEVTKIEKKGRQNRRVRIVLADPA